MKWIFLLVLFFWDATCLHRTHLVFMLVRHGARAPGEVTEAFKRIGVSYPKQLTQIGRNEHSKLGQKTKMEYFPINKPHNFQLSSSPSSRCLESMHSFAKSLGVSQNQHKNFQILPKTFFNQRKLSKFTEIQLRNFDVKFWKLSQKLKKAAKKSGVDLARTHYCPQCSDSDTPSEITRSFKKLSTIIACHRGNLIETMKTKRRLRNLLDKAFRLHYCHLAFPSKKDAKAYSADAVKVLGKSIVEFLKSNKSKRSLVEKQSGHFESQFQARQTTFMFAHDGNIIGFLRLFEKAREILKQRFYRPPFASHVKFELIQGFSSPSEMRDYYFGLFSKNKEIALKGKIYVRVKYMDRELPIKYCNYQNCSLAKFLKFLRKLLK